MDTQFCNTETGHHTGKDGGGGDKKFTKEHI
jgi:hypothetical protein